MPVLIGFARSPFAPANGVLGGWRPVDLTAVAAGTGGAATSVWRRQ